MNRPIELSHSSCLPAKASLFVIAGGINNFVHEMDKASGRMSVSAISKTSFVKTKDPYFFQLQNHLKLAKSLPAN